MTKLSCILAGLLMFIASCSLHPAVTIPDLVSTFDEPVHCESIYPQGKWQFVHSLTFSMADGKKGTVLGVSVLDGPIIKSALMTVEGFVLFEATFDGQIEVNRAVPPFDNEQFARGLMRDLQLIFFRPQSNKVQYGRLDNGSSICRYQEPSGQITDIVLFADQGWEINQYGADQRRTRAIKASPQMAGDRSGDWLPPRRLELYANDTAEYTIMMDLVSSEKN